MKIEVSFEARTSKLWLSEIPAFQKNRIGCQSKYTIKLLRFVTRKQIKQYLAV